MDSEKRPKGPTPPTRNALWAFGTWMKSDTGFIGCVDVIYADYWSALDTFVVREGWFEQQDIPPSTKDQIFYGLVGPGGVGAILAGEKELIQVDPPDGV